MQDIIEQLEQKRAPPNWAAVSDASTSSMPKAS